MGVEENKYLASEMDVDADRNRLSNFEQTWDPVTIRHLQDLGVSSGWKCLDVGAGYGSITSWLGKRVAPDGKVVATDIRSELHRDVSELVEIRQHDILNDELENDCYDLVHCRSLLQHLSDPLLALNRMAEAIKPDGWILVEEFDNLTSPTSDNNNEDADFYYKFSKETREVLSKYGLGDPSFGRKVPLMIEQLGFQEIGNEGSLFVHRGGDPWSESLATTGEAGFKLIADLLSEEEQHLIEELERCTKILRDPSFSHIGFPLVSVWGRKPK